jgi:ketosteroid isomerase-like protein
MSKARVEAIRGVYERWSEGDFRASVELFDPEVTLVMRPEFPDAGTYLGVEGIERYTRGFLEPWARITIEAEEIADAGDNLVVAVRQRGVGGASGAATEFRYFHVWSFCGDRVVRLETFREREEARRAAGHSDSA